MELNYDELMRIYRLEKNSSKLVDLEADFYNALNSFMQNEKKKYLDSLNDFSESKARNFSNLKKIIEEIFNLREKKILNKALIASRTKEIDSSNLCPQEEKTFNEILSILNSQREFFERVFNGETGEKNENTGKDLNKVSIRIICDVPSFIGTDLKEYGPYKEGESVELPYKIGQLFISRKLGEMK